MMFVHQNVAHNEIRVFGGNLHRGVFFLLCWFERFEHFFGNAATKIHPLHVHD